MDGRALVSICCITYNHGRFIRQGLDSMLMQKTSFPFEILIHDDASSDETPIIIDEYHKKYPHIVKPLCQSENQYSKGVRGLNIRFNFPRSEGKYIALCEGDDYWNDPLKLQKQIDLLESNIDYIACFTNATVIDEIKKEERSFVSKNLAEGVVSQQTIYEVGGGIYPTASLAFRNNKVDFSHMHRYPELAGDELIIFALAQSGKIYFLNQITCVYNRWASGVYSSLLSDRKALIHLKELEFNAYVRLQNDFGSPTRDLLAKKKSRTALWICRHTSDLQLITKYVPSLSAKQIYYLIKHKIRQLLSI